MRFRQSLGAYYSTHVYSESSWLTSGLHGRRIIGQPVFSGIYEVNNLIESIESCFTYLIICDLKPFHLTAIFNKLRLIRHDVIMQRHYYVRMQRHHVAGKTLFRGLSVH